jgi:hypothetical protein
MNTQRRVRIYKNRVPAEAWKWLCNQIPDHHPEFITLIKGGELHQQLEHSRWELELLRKLYNELLYAVARKFPSEDRHQTALRYIQEAERHQPSSAAEIIADSVNQPRDERS